MSSKHVLPIENHSTKTEMSSTPQPAEAEEEVPFSTEAYVKAQTLAIRERMQHFSGKLYLEIGGKFLRDGHASRVLKGFEPQCKVTVLRSVNVKFDIIMCVNARDMSGGREWEEGKSYQETLFTQLEEIGKAGMPRPKIAINMFDGQEEAAKLSEDLKRKGYSVYFRRPIRGYPNDFATILGSDGFDKDDYIQTDGNLIIVISPGSSSGKLSTCLGQIYLDTKHSLDSGYAKYELFPIWNLPLEHPINLTYEAATADIGDYNVIDELHLKAYGVSSVNYNRDIEAFPLLQGMMARICDENNYTRTYKSPTDMGINMAAEGIVDDHVLKLSSIAEIESRIKRYQKLVDRGRGKQEWVDTCEKVLERAKAQL